MGSLKELESVQNRILQRIAALELTILPQQISSLSLSSHDGAAGDLHSTESRLSVILDAGGAREFSFMRVPSDYYERPLECRRDILGAASVDNLCKSIVMVNTQAYANVTDVAVTTELVPTSQ